MTQREKLIERMRRRPSEMSFDDVCKVLEEFGWSKDRERGSHVIFIKEGEIPLPPVPKVHRRMVKRTYLVMLCERLGLDE
ncbi:MAG: type II toxin-antitoxin system HicA family toxin [Thermomicrobiales bacterium]